MLQKMPPIVGRGLAHVRFRIDHVVALRAGIANAPASIIVTSSAFRPGGALPARHTADGPGISPPIAWRGIPADARSIAIVIEGIDSPSPMPVVHGIVVRLPPRDGELVEGALRENGATVVVGRNSFFGATWLPPDPPPGHGDHRYVFEVFALDCDPDTRAASWPGIARRHARRPHASSRPARRDVSPCHLILSIRDRAGGRVQALWRRVRRQGGHDRDRPRRVRGGARRVRQRQDDARQDDQPARRARRRHRAGRGQGCPRRGRRRVAPAHRLRDPARRPVAAPHGRGQRRHRAALARLGGQRDPTRASPSCSRSSGCQMSATDFPNSCRAASASVSASHARSPRSPRCSSLDEPLGALDPITRLGLQRELARIHRELSYIGDGHARHGRGVHARRSDRRDVPRRAPPARDAARSFASTPADDYVAKLVGLAREQAEVVRAL